MKIAYIFLNGELLGKKEFYENFISENKGDIFCADGGANIAYSLNLIPLEIWGDFDSIDSKILNHYKNNDVILKNFPVEKDKTDAELLLDYLKNQCYEKIYCIAGLGGDIDHELTNINLCFKYKNLIFLKEKEILFYVNKNHIFKNLKGVKISFIIYSDKIESLSLKGFQYEIENLNLLRGDSRCISNTIFKDIAEISFKKGKLLGVILKL